VTRAPALALVLLLGCPDRPPRGYDAPPADGIAITCPVTGERCTKTAETPAAVFDHRTYYFCRQEAADRFAKAPAKYADPPKTPGP
jgi:YHS domain-containing protein